MDEPYYDDEHDDDWTTPLRTRISWRWRRRTYLIRDRLTRRQRQQARYESLLAKYEALAADRAVWIERAHGREEGWPLPPNPQDPWYDPLPPR